MCNSATLGSAPAREGGTTPIRDVQDHLHPVSDVKDTVVLNVTQGLLEGCCLAQQPIRSYRKYLELYTFKGCRRTECMC